MPQPRIYRDQAEKQAAYRYRNGKQRPIKTLLANLALQLHSAISDAVECDTWPLPKELLGAQAENTLVNLIALYNPVYNEFSNPNGKFKRCNNPWRLEEIKTPNKTV